jgi:hypothetical protein
MSIIKGLFIGLKNLRVIPFNEMTPEIHDTLGSNLAKVMMVAKMSDAKLTKAQREYVVNQAKQLQEFEDRYITGVKDRSGNVIKSDKGIKDTKSAKIFNRMGEELDPKKPIVGGTQQGKKIDRETLSRLAERGPQLIKQKIADRKINEVKDVKQRIESGVATTIERILAMDPVDAMKEASAVIGRRGQYKNLSEQDAKKILQDTEDHIFERNIKPKETDMDFDDNDFAVGGRVGLKSGSFLVKGAKELGKKYRGSTLEALLENPKLLGTELSYEGLMEILRMSGMMQKGGRVGFKKGMDRRTFMKIMGGLTTLPIVGKFFKGAEVAAPVTQKVMENFSSKAPEAPAYFFDLMTKIKMFGKKSKVGPSDRVDEYSYTGKNGDEYTLTEDITTGDAQITKDKIGGRSYEEGSYDVIEDRTVMEYKAPKQDVDVETQKATNEAAEYEEYRVEFDQDGTEAGADAIDEVIQKEIIEEAGEEATSIKKAEGGRIPFIFGGGIFKAVIKNLAKEKGISPSEYLNITNYRLLPDSAKRIMSKSEYLKLKEEMTGKRIEMVENVRDMIESRLAFDKSKADLAASMNKASPGYGDAAVKMMFPEGSFKSPVPAGAGEKDVMMMEQLIKNLQTKGRKENASGGLAGMLGE